MLGIKQEGLAYQLGDAWNQKQISALEQKELIDEALLQEVAKQLKVLLRQLRILMKRRRLFISTHSMTQASAIAMEHLMLSNAPLIL